MTEGFGHRLRRLLRPGDPAALTLAEFFDRHYYPHALATKRRPRYDLLIFNRHLREGLGQRPLAGIGAQDLDSWLRDHLLAGYAPGTVNKHIFLINRLFNLARHWGLIGNAPGGPRQKRLPMGDYRQRFATAAELQSLIAACRADGHLHLDSFVQLLILTGARSSEARLARWRDVDLPGRVWTVPISKNGRARRIVLSTAALRLLAELHGRNIAARLPVSVDDPLFVNPRTRKPYHSFHQAWDRARKAAAMEGLRLHDLRHTFASLLINNGATIYEVQKLLGHHHVSMTERYAHLMPDTLRRRVEIIPAALGRAAAAMAPRSVPQPATGTMQRS